MGLSLQSNYNIQRKGIYSQPIITLKVYRNRTIWGPDTLVRTLLKINLGPIKSRIIFRGSGIRLYQDPSSLHRIPFLLGIVDGGARSLLYRLHYLQRYGTGPSSR